MREPLSALTRAAWRVRRASGPVRLVFGEGRRLSIAEVFRTVPARSIEQVTPWPAIRGWHGSLSHWLPWSER